MHSFHPRPVVSLNLITCEISRISSICILYLTITQPWNLPQLSTSSEFHVLLHESGFWVCFFFFFYCLFCCTSAQECDWFKTDLGSVFFMWLKQNWLSAVIWIWAQHACSQYGWCSSKCIVQYVTPHAAALYHLPWRQPSRLSRGKTRVETF